MSVSGNSANIQCYNMWHKYKIVKTQTDNSEQLEMHSILSELVS